MTKTKATKAPKTATPARVRIHTIDSELIGQELSDAASLVAGLVAKQGEYAQGNIRVARVGSRTVITASARGEHGGESVMTRRGVQGNTAHNVAAYDVAIVKGAEVSARKNDRNAAVVSEAMARLPLLEKWIAEGRVGKRPCAKLSGKHYAVCVAENNKHADRVRVVVEALA